MTDKELITAFNFLDNLRESGVTNMFGAAPYLVEAFDLPQQDARTVLKSWMNTFSDESVEDRVAKIK
jgi:hypothetical protein